MFALPWSLLCFSPNVGGRASDPKLSGQAPVGLVPWVSKPVVCGAVCVGEESHPGHEDAPFLGVTCGCCDAPICFWPSVKGLQLAPFLAMAPFRPDTGNGLVTCADLGHLVPVLSVYFTVTIFDF